MLEAGLSVAAAAFAALATITNRVHNRINDMDKRVDSMELRVAENYATRAEVAAALDRIDAHVLRIENKLDSLTHLPCVISTKT